MKSNLPAPVRALNAVNTLINCKARQYQQALDYSRDCVIAMETCTDFVTRNKSWLESEVKHAVIVADSLRLELRQLQDRKARLTAPATLQPQAI